MNLRFICAQPATKYYLWQVELMIKNFMSVGINPNNIDIVCAKINGQIPQEWSDLCNKYNYVRFFFYDDTRTEPRYISSIRPHILKKHFLKYPELGLDAIFYHDCDIVFTKPIDWSKFLADKKWYGSDCRWYIGHDYIASKGDIVLQTMCEIAQIHPEIIRLNELNSIGAQYLMKGVDFYYWEEVEIIAERLFSQISDLNVEIKKNNPTYHELQIWCADMWAVLWTAWKRGFDTLCHDDLQFSWATSHIDAWEKFNIMHNAGVVGPNEGLFYKALYVETYPPKDLVINENTCSFKYYQLLKELL